RRRRFSLLFRYSCRHSHFSRLHGSRTRPLHRPDNALLPREIPEDHAPAASVTSLGPVTFSALEHLTSQLLRNLSRVAASKPTSWLSRHPNIVSHLASTWGP